MFAPVKLYDLFCFQRMSESLQDVLYHVETHFILYVFDIYPFFLIYLFSFSTCFTCLCLMVSFSIAFSIVWCVQWTVTPDVNVLF